MATTRSFNCYLVGEGPMGELVLVLVPCTCPSPVTPYVVPPANGEPSAFPTFKFKAEEYYLAAALHATEEFNCYLAGEGPMGQLVLVLAPCTSPSSPVTTWEEISVRPVGAEPSAFEFKAAAAAIAAAALIPADFNGYPAGDQLIGFVPCFSFPPVIAPPIPFAYLGQDHVPAAAAPAGGVQRPAAVGGFGPFVLVGWARPPPGLFKLNFDGSVLYDGSGRASIGGVIRDSNGRVVLAFADATEHASVGEVEARALLRGLRLALAHGCYCLIAEGDDLTLVQQLHRGSEPTRMSPAIKDEIIRAQRFFAFVKVRHVYREANKVAHALCRHAYKPQPQQQVPTAAIGIPFAVWEKAEDDRNGVPHKRFLRRRRSF